MTRLSPQTAAYLTHPAVLCALALAIAGLIVFSSYQRLIRATTEPDTTIMAPAQTAHPADNDIEAIITMNLFGKNAPQTQEPPQENLPQTQLKLQLRGAFSHTDSERASALIATDQTDEARLYFVGDNLPGGAQLVAVYPSYVVLERDLRREKLLFARDQEHATQPTRRRNAQQATKPSEPSQTPAAPARPAPSAEPATPSLYELRQRWGEQD